MATVTPANPPALVATCPLTVKVAGGAGGVGGVGGVGGGFGGVGGAGGAVAVLPKPRVDSVVATGSTVSRLFPAVLRKKARCRES